jgi:hypothetical protein
MSFSSSEGPEAGRIFLWPRFHGNGYELIEQFGSETFARVVLNDEAFSDGKKADIGRIDRHMADVANRRNALCPRKFVESNPASLAQPVTPSRLSAPARSFS